ncbi:antigen 5 like allergen Cul n 1 [Drosophila eugracilis]|uniref:antigen 5 like allergen Cul n 1 n=1 Tax=Drosophila eugracilis TaxID=29029 RepID=UPI0007E64FA9|nr:antigen 5 like allergen Cul n 1 [Drosophila eugracilis]
MQRLQFTFLLSSVLFLRLRTLLAIDFCQIKSCQGKNHIGCNNDMMFDHNCLRFHGLVNMAYFREYLLELHNGYRQEVANNSFIDLPPAQKMPELVWDQYLSVVAEYHLKRCQQELPDNSCCATDDFADPHFNFAEDFYPRPVIPQSNVREMTILAEQWLDELYDMDDIVTDEAESDIRNIINDQSAYMGCAAGQDYDLWNIHFVLICYYSSGPPHTGQLYTAGQFNASLCPHGPSDEYPSLCKTLTLND